MTSDTKLSVKIAKLGQTNPTVKEALAAFDAAMKAAVDAKVALQTVLRDTPEWRLLEGTGGEPFVSVSNYGAVELVSRVRGEWEPRPDILAPQTLNALITGKLLTDEEKRQLLINQGVCLTKKERRPESDTNEILRVSGFDDEIPF